MLLRYVMKLFSVSSPCVQTIRMSSMYRRNIIMIKINPTHQSPSRSLITQHYLIFKKYFTKKQPILNSTDHYQKIFKDKPFIAYRRSPNLRDLLVPAKLNNTNTTPKLPGSGTFRCNSTHGCLDHLPLH